MGDGETVASSPLPKILIKLKSSARNNTKPEQPKNQPPFDGAVHTEPTSQSDSAGKRTCAKRDIDSICELDTCAEELNDDLVDFGFETTPGDEFRSNLDVAGIRVRPVNDKSALQIARKTADDSVPRGRARRTKSAKGEDTGRVETAVYESLYVTEGTKSRTDWVLFDPLRGYPTGFGYPPPAVRRFAAYKPGHMKIVEFNVVSRSLRIKTTPVLLQGREVSYTTTGPKLIEVDDANRRAKNGKGGRKCKNTRLLLPIEDAGELSDKIANDAATG